MKKWVEKFVEQFDWNSSGKGREVPFKVNEETATLLYILDTYNKYLLEVDQHPVRKVREMLDEFARELLSGEEKDLERTLFRFRKFFSSYRIDEVTFVQKSFDEFRGIIWEVVDQLAEDFTNERSEDSEIKQSFNQLKEAVESNSIEMLKSQSRKFIDSYVEHNFKKEKRRSKKMQTINKNLNVVKKQLTEASSEARRDHLTGAYNRRSFDEHSKHEAMTHLISEKPVTMLVLDIDHFKRINDKYGHGIGDFVLKECVGLLQRAFNRENHFVARIGGEEFAIVLSNTPAEVAAQLADDVLKQARRAVFVQENMKLSFTLSAGIAQLAPGENLDKWLKRADEALYMAKDGGRDRMMVAPLKGFKKAA